MPLYNSRAQVQSSTEVRANSSRFKETGKRGSGIRSEVKLKILSKRQAVRIRPLQVFYAVVMEVRNSLQYLMSRIKSHSVELDEFADLECPPLFNPTHGKPKVTRIRRRSLHVPLSMRWFSNCPSWIFCDSVRNQSFKAFVEAQVPNDLFSFEARNVGWECKTVIDVRDWQTLPSFYPCALLN